MDNLDVNALFLGPKSENHDFFKRLLDFLMDEHIHWRRNFHPDDAPFVTLPKKRTEFFMQSQDRTEEVLLELSSRLKAKSMPWFSPRYLGHMNSDLLIPAVLGSMATILYNPNNCAFEGSPATTDLELEVGRQLAAMIGYSANSAWGHITSGGTVANIEALWSARNAKSLPLAAREVAPDLVTDWSNHMLRHASMTAILDLVSALREAGKLHDALQRSIRAKGITQLGPTRVFVPQTRHYCWEKAMDILGMGSDALVHIPVRSDFRMDVNALAAQLEECLHRDIPVLAVVAVVGTTEEGAIDEIHHIAALKKAYEAKGLGFFLHIDAAYGGYGRTFFLDKNNTFMTHEAVCAMNETEMDIRLYDEWPDNEVHRAYEAMPEADAVTIDSHKMGYVPYAAGAIVHKDKRILDCVGYHAPYTASGDEDNQLGNFILEGSKAGAAAAAVWAAHKAVPLNVSGHGRIVARSLEAAATFYHNLSTMPPVHAMDGHTYIATALTRPDFNIVAFAFNREGNANLDTMNAINRRVYDRCSYVAGPIYKTDFITSKTSLDHHEYGDSTLPFLERLGIGGKEWQRVGTVFVLRACIMTPFLAEGTTYTAYWQRFLSIMASILGE
ncbi:pyridoxal phosphate-dependent decarboxylase family protein [Desulfovibrio inopinatus]|uniref:pyridoxal phosphate-dependent decarboxylase family protein n=1 Tax=Desulfovibrio inopinatus TaxID=102109 RepID=UPI0004294FC1|nr:pyridoxal-dependent decarboxylase [Desulfovibrio inopinatus]